MAIAMLMFEDFMLDPQREERSKIRAILLRPEEPQLELESVPREVTAHSSAEVTPPPMDTSEMTAVTHPELNPFPDQALPPGFKEQPLG